MQQGETFCKIGTTAVFYEEENKAFIHIIQMKKQQKSQQKFKWGRKNIF